MINNTINFFDKKNIFIVGLHRSGTTLLTDFLKLHPSVSGFENTGFPKDEGQFLQSVFPQAKKYGGPGKFGFNPHSHLTETSTLLTNENIQKLQIEWSFQWDMSKIFLLEKSPPNLLKTRFLQKVFPNTYFILITRHPIAVSYATQKWSKTSIKSLLKHWLKCHSIYSEDSQFLNNVYSVTYENLMANPIYELKEIYHFLGLPWIDTIEKTLSSKIDRSINSKYLNQWESEYRNFNWIKKYTYRQLDQKLRKYNYSLKNI